MTCDEYPGYGQLLVIHGYPWIVFFLCVVFRFSAANNDVFSLFVPLHEWALIDILAASKM